MTTKKNKQAFLTFYKKRERDGIDLSEKNNVIITVGISKSGKTTYAKQVKEEYGDSVIHLSSDGIRDELFNGEYNQDENKKVFEVMRERLDKALRNKSGATIIYDATNLSRKYRRHLVEAIEGQGGLATAMVILRPLDDILETAQEEDFPEEAIYKQLATFQPPSFYEGYDEIGYIHNGSEDMEELEPFVLPDTPAEVTATGFPYRSLMQGFDQKSSYHDHDLWEHTIKTFQKVHGADIFTAVAALWHDVGKLYTQKIKNGTASYFGHENASSYLYLERAHRTRMNEAQLHGVLSVSLIIQNHMRIKHAKTARAVRRLKEAVTPGLMPELALLNWADNLSHKEE